MHLVDQPPRNRSLWLGKRCLNEHRRVQFWGGQGRWQGDSASEIYIHLKHTTLIHRSIVAIKMTYRKAPPTFQINRKKEALPTPSPSLFLVQILGILLWCLFPLKHPLAPPFSLSFLIPALRVCQDGAWGQECEWGRICIIGSYGATPPWMSSWLKLDTSYLK